MVDWNKEVKFSDLLGRKPKEADDTIIPAPEVPNADEVQPAAELSPPPAPTPAAPVAVSPAPPVPPAPAQVQAPAVLAEPELEPGRQEVSEAPARSAESAKSRASRSFSSVESCGYQVPENGEKWVDMDAF